MIHVLHIFRLCTLVIAIVVSPQAALGQTGDPPETRIEAVNRGVIGMLGGVPGGTYNRMVQDLALALDDGYDLRLLPITGRGSVRSVEDLVYLKGIDVAIIQSDVLDFYKSSGRIPDIEDKLRYITKLYNEEFHILARDDVKTVEDLNGRDVNLGSSSSGTHMTAQLIFDQLGVAVNVKSDDAAIALDKLKKGQIDAMVWVVGKPVSAIKDLPWDANLHFVSVPYANVEGAYVPAILRADDYPNLIENGESVETVAVAAIMATYAWPRSHPRRTRVETFVKKLHTNFDRMLDDPFHDKWSEVSLNANVPGWTQFSTNGVQ